MNTSFEDANAAADRVAINVIVVEAADATADRVAVNATIVNEGAHAVAGRVSAILSEHRLIISRPSAPRFANFK